MKVSVEYDEYWEPVLLKVKSRNSYGELEITEDLYNRYNKAIEEIEKVWQEIKDLEK